MKSRHQTFLIKPASSKCNLNCNYCFYHAIAKLRNNKSSCIMTKDVVDKLLKMIFDDYAIASVSFMFQGGEPLLAGYDFFQYFVEKTKLLNHRKIAIAYSLQTNGTLLDNKILQLLKDNNFLVGISIDGPKHIHNMCRDNSFDSAIKGLEQLKFWEIPFNILSVVTKQSSKYANEIYAFFKSKGVEFIQFIPFLAINDQQSIHQPSPLQFGNFLNTLFIDWFRDIMSGKMISISSFEDIIKNMLQVGGATCGMNGNCSLNLVIESEGDIYPCDFYTKDKDCLSNLKNITNLADLLSLKSTHNFLQSDFIHYNCKVCPYIKICKGGCKAYKDNNGLYYYCESYKALFKKQALNLNTLASLFHRKMRVKNL